MKTTDLCTHGTFGTPHRLPGSTAHGGVDSARILERQSLDKRLRHSWPHHNICNILKRSKPCSRSSGRISGGHRSGQGAALAQAILETLASRVRWSSPRTTKTSRCSRTQTHVSEMEPWVIIRIQDIQTIFSTWMRLAHLQLYRLPKD